MLRETPLGTVIRAEWGEKHFGLVKKTEQEMHREICGAPKKNGLPCRGKPWKKFGYYCYTHKLTGEINETRGTNTLPASYRNKTPVLRKQEIRFSLTSCALCPVRRECEQYIPGHYCRIEERMIEQFFLTVKEDFPSLKKTDDYLMIQAGLAWINAWRGRVVQTRLPLEEAESSRLTWIGPRESKEFRELMKALGLTPKERYEREKTGLGAEALPGNVTLAQLMSEFKKEGIEEVTVSKTVAIKKNRGEKELEKFDR